MNTWSDIVHHIDERFEIAATRGEGVALHWQFPTSDGGEILQRQRIQAVDCDGQRYVAVVCEVASSHRLCPAEAMRFNMSMAIGALGLLDETIVLRTYIAMESIDSAAFDQVVETTAREAARLRCHMVGTASLEHVVTAVGHWM